MILIMIDRGKPPGCTIKESRRLAIVQMRYPKALCIPLTQNQYAIVEPENYWREDIAAHLWYARWSPSSRTFYACRKPCSKELQLHSVITGYQETDHRNSNGLDNRISNLRDVTRSQNLMNSSLRSDNTSDHVGVWLDKRCNKWCVQIMVNQCDVRLGYFDDYDVAVGIRHAAQQFLFGEYAPDCCDSPGNVVPLSPEQIARCEAARDYLSSEAIMARRETARRRDFDIRVI